MKGIDTLIKLQKRSLDALRRKMASYESQKRQLQNASLRLNRELEEEIKTAGKQPEMAHFFGRFAERIKKRQEEIAKEIASLDKQMVKLADEIAVEFGEVKKLEIAKENIKKREQAKEKRRETIAFDEVAGQQHERKKKKEKI